MLIPPGHPVAQPGGSTRDDGVWDEDTWHMGMPSEQAALEALRWNWGRAYEIGCDEGLWWFRRRYGRGGTETAATPDGLHAQIITDYAVFPASQDALTGGPAQPEAASSQSTGTCDAKAIQ